MVWRVEGEINLIVTKHGNGALVFFWGGGGGEGFKKFKMAAAYDAATCFFCFSYRSTTQNPNLYFNAKFHFISKLRHFLDFLMFFVKIEQN